MFNYNLLKEATFKYNIKYIDNIFNTISKVVSKKQKGILNIVFLDNDSIQKLNNDHRKIDKTTDVLSFHYYDDFSNLGDEDLAGEIILSEEKIISQGKEYELGSEKEFYKLLIHSILHIIGYDHELDNEYKIMQALEKKVWKEVFEK